MSARQPGAPWLLVVGAHRSGTSAVTGALGALGFTTPAIHDRMEWSQSNPEHWESLSLTLFDEEILNRLGGSWDGPPDMTTGWDRRPEVGDLPDPNAILCSTFPTGPAVWKDPRICLLLAYWRRALVAPLAAVLIWRHPLAVARSLRQRDRIPLTDGLALWERYNREAIMGLRGVDTYVVAYESMMGDPKAAITDMAGWLGSLDQFRRLAGEWKVDEAAAMLDGGLTHQTRADPHEQGLVRQSQYEVAELLTSHAGGHRPLDLTPPTEEPDAVSAVIRLRRELGSTRRQLDRSEDRLARAERSLEVMRTSMSWRLTAPARSATELVTRLRKASSDPSD